MQTKRRLTGVSVAIQATLMAQRNDQPAIEKKKPSEFSIKIANCLEEREAAYRLAYQVYLDKGFIKENPNEWLVKNYDTDEATTILIAKDQNQNIVGTLTLVFDGQSKLPAQKIYPEEIKILKTANEKIVEISRLVINPEYRNSKDILVLLFNYLAIYSSYNKNYSCLVIEVNPRHKNYYKELLGFSEIGCEKPCPSVQNAPATLLYLSLSTYHNEVNRCKKLNALHKKERTLYPFFINPEQETLVAHYLKNQFKPMTIEEKLYFGFSESGISQIVAV